MDWYVIALVGLFGFVGLGLFLQAVVGKVRDPEGAASGVCFIAAAAATYALMEWWPLVAGAAAAVVCRALAPSPVERDAPVVEQRGRWSGASYSQPVLQHVAKHPVEETIEAIRQTYDGIDPHLRPLAKETLDTWYERAQRDDFGPSSLAEAFLDFVHELRDRLARGGFEPTDRFILEVFDLMVLQQALALHTRQASMQSMQRPGAQRAAA